MLPKNLISNSITDKKDKIWPETEKILDIKEEKMNERIGKINKHEQFA